MKTALHFPRDVRWAAGPSEKAELQSFNLTETETLMTDERLALAELAAKSRADLAHVADQLRTRWPKLGTFMDDAETDALAYPYLLRKLAVTRPNQVWAMDLTYFPMARGFVYLCAVVDWFSRRALVMVAIDHDGSRLLHRRGACSMAKRSSSIGVMTTP